MLLATRRDAPLQKMVG